MYKDQAESSKTGSDDVKNEIEFSCHVPCIRMQHLLRAAFFDKVPKKSFSKPGTS
jgi:hypothetical protein